MFSLHDPFDADEKPTVRECPSGAWLVKTDRAARKISAIIDALESGTEPTDLIETLREVHKMVNGR